MRAGYRHKPACYIINYKNQLYIHRVITTAADAVQPGLWVIAAVYEIISFINIVKVNSKCNGIVAITHKRKYIVGGMGFLHLVLCDST